MKSIISAIFLLAGAQFVQADSIAIHSQPGAFNVVAIYGTSEQVAQTLQSLKASEACLAVGEKVREQPLIQMKNQQRQQLTQSNIVFADNDFNGLTNDFLGWNFSVGSGSPDLPTVVAKQLAGLQRIDLSGMDPMSEAYAEVDSCTIVWPLTDEQSDRGLKYLKRSAHKAVGSNWLKSPTITHLLVPNAFVNELQNEMSESAKRAITNGRLRVYGY